MHGCRPTTATIRTILNRRVNVYRYSNPTATPAGPVSTKQREAVYPHGTVCMFLVKMILGNNGDRSAGTDKIGRQMLDRIWLGQCRGIEDVQCRQRCSICTAETYRFTCSLDPCQTSAGSSLGGEHGGLLLVLDLLLRMIGIWPSSAPPVAWLYV